MVVIYSFTTSAQDIMVDYQEIYHGYRLRDFTLQITDSLSLWQVATDDYKAKYKDTTLLVNGYKYNTYEITRISSPIYDNYNHKKFILKKYKQNKIISTRIHRGKRWFIEDSLGNIKWKMLNKTKEIMGYHCKSATATFRGREYVVFYTEQIPVSEGPWKLFGLPGLILEVYTVDGEYVFKANKVTINYSVPIELPKYYNEELTPWSEMTAILVKHHENRVNSRRARAIRDNEYGSLRSKIENIEVIHPIFSPQGVLIFDHTNDKEEE